MFNIPSKILLVFIAAFVIVVSCKSGKKATTSATPAKNPAASTIVLTYQGGVKNIFENNCTRCHNNPEKKKGDFTSFAGLKAKIDNGTFKDRVIVQKDMPPREPLSDEDFNTLRKWLEAGAPEQ